MIVADTSALVAIALDEPECDMFMSIIRKSRKVLISTVSIVEARMVVYGREGQKLLVFLDDLLRLPMFIQVPPTSADADAAFAAFVVYGKGSGHPANLNFGDLFPYSLAKSRGLPLLFKGQDFGHTDIVAAT